MKSRFLCSQCDKSLALLPLNLTLGEVNCVCGTLHKVIVIFSDSNIFRLREAHKNEAPETLLLNCSVKVCGPLPQRQGV